MGWANAKRRETTADFAATIAYMGMGIDTYTESCTSINYTSAVSESIIMNMNQRMACNTSILDACTSTMYVFVWTYLKQLVDAGSVDCLLLSSSQIYAINLSIWSISHQPAIFAATLTTQLFVAYFWTSTSSRQYQQQLWNEIDNTNQIWMWTHLIEVY